MSSRAALDLLKSELGILMEPSEANSYAAFPSLPRCLQEVKQRLSQDPHVPVVLVRARPRPQRHPIHLARVARVHRTACRDVAKQQQHALLGQPRPAARAQRRAHLAPHTAPDIGGQHQDRPARTHPIHEVKIFHEVRTVQDQPEILDGTAVVQLELNYVNMPSPAKAFEVLDGHGVLVILGVPSPNRP